MQLHFTSFRLRSNSICHRLCTIIICLCSYGLFCAHEFWIWPSTFRPKPGEEVLLDLVVGENFEGELWGKRSQRALSLDLFSATDSVSLLPQAQRSDSLPIRFMCAKPGVHVLTMRSHNSYIELSGADFEAYLLEDGIEGIAELRRQRGQTGQSARELYQRCAKALLQAGKKQDYTWGRVCGMPLEIVPLKNPYALRPGAVLPVRVLFEGKPLANVVVRSWHKTAAQLTGSERYRVNSDGIAEIPLGARGFWMLSIVHMLENADASQSDYQSYWGSLTFAL